MKRDMELCRKILFAIEEEYIDVAIRNLKIENYPMEQVAYHCKILHEAGLVSDYEAKYGGNHIISFDVGSITWNGHEYLDTIRQDSRWNEIKKQIISKSLPMTIDVITRVASSSIAETIKQIFNESAK